MTPGTGKRVGRSPDDGPKVGRGVRRTSGVRPVSRSLACSLADERARVGRLLEEEDRARADGYRVIAGVDEVGRGCLAGPVYAGAAVLPCGHVIAGLDDSKALEPEVREALTRSLRRSGAGLGLGAATSAEIDALGIAVATELAMRRALAALARSGFAPDLVLVDAVRIPGLSVEQRAFVKGDARVAAIAAASIVAKTARDHEMECWDDRYPYYGFASNRGYGTPDHLRALERHGPSPIHRLSFDRVLPSRRQARAA